MGDPYVIWGSAGHALVLREIIEEQGGEVIAVIDNNPKAKSIDVNIPLYFGENGLIDFLGAFRKKTKVQEQIKALNGVVAVGNVGKDRENIFRIFELHGLNIPSIIASDCTIFQSAKIGPSCYILQNSVINSNVRLGKGCQVNNSAFIGHECLIGNGVHIAPQATVCGCVSIGNNVFIGANSTILPRLNIGTGSIIGAGSVVTNDIQANTTVIGNPARPQEMR